MELLANIDPTAAARLATQQDPAELARKLGKLAAANPQKLWAAAEQFEAYFLQMMLSSMRETTMKSDLFGDSNADRIYRELHDQYLAESMAKSHEFGLSRMIVDWVTETRPDLLADRAAAVDTYKGVARVGEVRLLEESAETS